MFTILRKPPLVGIVAFVAVLLFQPLGHVVMIVMEKLLQNGNAWYSPLWQSGPEVPEGFENFAVLETNLYWSAFALGLLGFAIIYWGVRRNSEIAGTWAGFIGATLLWTGWVEFSLHYFARFFQVRALCAPGEWAHACAGNPATKPEYFLLQASVGLLIATLLFFVLNKESRCNAFRWMHRNLRMKVGEPTRGMKRNFANIVAIETITILWFFYVYLMLVYDETVFGERHWFTWASFVGFWAWSLYLMQRLIRYKRVASALRYAIPTAIIFWNAVEIMGRWDWFSEFWIHPLDYKLEATLLVVFVVLFCFVSIRSALDKSRQIQ